MDSVVNISWIKLAIFSLILLIPLAINYRYKLGIAKDTSISVLRMDSAADPDRRLLRVPLSPK